MKIADSSVLMSARGDYTYYERTASYVQTFRRQSATQESLQTGNLSAGTSGAGRTANSSSRANGDDFADALYAGYTKDGALSDEGEGRRAVRTGAVTSSGASLREVSAGGLMEELLGLLLSRMFRSGMFANALSAGGALPLYSLTDFSPTAMRVNKYECEEVAFQTQGQAVTEDGRVLSFAMNISLSRTLIEATQVSVPALSSFLMDPLVVNVGRAVTAVSDQTFRFDLDADGQEEDVASLASGSGFLALDKNGDGVINNGSELFGAVSGDGFGDLRTYDADGNGWIDENDEVFEKLLVWYRDGDGQEQLVHLKDADIGAICLGEQATDFGLTGTDGRVNGRMRSTGFFLKESGGIGTVQHVDLAVHRDGENDAPLSDRAQSIGGENFVSGYGRGDRVVPDVLVVPVGGASTGGNSSDSGDTASRTEETAARAEKSASQEESAKEAAAKRRARAAEDKERLLKEQQERRADRKQRNEEMIEEHIEHRREEEERIEELFADREEQRELASEAADEREAVREEFEAVHAARKEALQSA